MRVFLTIFSILFSFCITKNINAFSLKLFNFKTQAPKSCEQSNPYCVTTNQLITHSLRYSYDSREQIERIFQARARTKEAIGNILPHLTVSAAFGLPGLDTLDMGSSFIGFLFPNRWFDWRRNRVEASAAKESLYTLLANRVNAVQDMYYSIQIQEWGITVWRHYSEQIKEVITLLRQQVQSGLRTISESDFNTLENLHARYEYDLATLDALPTTKALMAQAVGLGFDKDWTKYQFMTTHFHPLHEDRDWGDSPEALDQVFPSCLNRHEHEPDDPIVAQECIDEALKKSTEIKTIHFLINAAKQGKRSSYFDFFDPRSGNSLGLGIGQRIKINRSQISVLEVQRDRAEAQIRADLFAAHNDLECGMERYSSAELGLKNLNALAKDTENMFTNPNHPFDINLVLRTYDFAVESAIRYIFAYFEVREAQAVFNRFTWNGPLYKLVKDFADNSFRSDYKDVNFKHRSRVSKWFSRRNRR